MCWKANISTKIKDVLRDHSHCIKALAGLQNRMNDEKVLGKIRMGAGRMPSFASIIAGKEEAIIAYLFEKNSRPAREIASLKEINQSEAANEAAGE